MDPSQREWVLLALRKGPLDRIHLMKSLFLLWIRADRNIPGYFEFAPYLYGPFSLGVYSALADVQKEGLVVQPPHLVQDWAPYYLTDKGRQAAQEAVQLKSPGLLDLLDRITSEVSQLGFQDLLRKVYKEAPEFAVNSLMKQVVQA